MKLRIQFTKEEPVRYISHLDLARAFERALRRAKLPLALSEGFNPHIKVAYASALSVGVTSSSEFVDIELRETLPEDTAVTALKQQLPAGFHIVDYRMMATNPAALMKVVNMAGYTLEVPLSQPVGENVLRAQLAALRQAREIIFRRTSPKGVRTIDLRPLIRDLGLLEIGADWVKLALQVHITDKGSVKPQEVLQVLREQYALPLREDAAVIHRNLLGVLRNNKLLSPLDVYK